MTMNTQVSAGFAEVNTRLLQIRNLVTGGSLDVSGLNTTAQDVVNALNEVLSIASSATGVIDDAALSTAVDKAYSAQKVAQLIATAKQEAKDELIDGAPGTADTLIELFNQITANGGDVAAALSATAANATLAQQGVDDAAAAQGTANTALATANTAATDVSTLAGAVGNTTTDYAAIVAAGL